jgi:hypothetical protein
MSKTLETIVTKLSELEVQELVDLQEQIAQHLRQRLQTPPKMKHVVTTADGRLLENFDPYKPTTNEEAKAALALLDEMDKLAIRIGEHWQGNPDAVEAVNEGRNRLENGNY